MIENKVYEVSLSKYRGSCPGRVVLAPPRSFFLLSGVKKYTLCLFLCQYVSGNFHRHEASLASRGLGLEGSSVESVKPPKLVFYLGWQNTVSSI